MRLKYYLLLCLILGIVGVILILIGGPEINNNLITTIGVTLLIPLFIEGLRGKDLKRIALINYIRRKLKVFQN